MTRHQTAELVDPGFYFDLRHLRFASIDQTSPLPGLIDSIWYRVPILAMFLIAPLLGLAFVIFLPFIGFAMVGNLLVRKAIAAFRR